MFTVGNGTAQCINVNSFNLRYPNPDNATFNWYMGDGRTYNTTNINHTYARPDTYRVRLVTTSPQGCIDSARVDLTVHPQPSGSITASDVRICEGTPAVLTATGGVRYDWYRNNTLIPNAIASTYNALLAGTYTMEVTDANGCKNAGTNSVSFDVVAKPTADFLFDRYCIDLPVQFTNRSNSAASGAVTYLWDFGDGNTSTLREPAFTFSKEGAQNVKLSVTPTFCPQLVTTVQKEIRVEKPVPGMHYTPLNALTNRQLNLKARSLGVSGYTWNPSTFLNSATSANPVFYGNREQQYTVTYNTISGCTTVDTLLVRIFNEREIYVPTAFSPNGDGNNDRMYPFLVGISELKVFRIMNRWGVVVYEAKTDLPGWDGTFRGAPQPVGAYVWEAMGVDVAGATLVRKGTFTLIR
jgi:gliding motility-associated-like protein